MIDVNVTCPDDGKTQVPAVINLDDIKVVTSDEHTRDIKVDDTLSIRMKYPSMDEFIKTNYNLSQISLLKIDTEGYESEVLKGFRGILSRINVIQFEYGKANLLAKYFLKDY